MYSHVPIVVVYIYGCYGLLDQNEKNFVIMLSQLFIGIYITFGVKGGIIDGTAHFSGRKSACHCQAATIRSI